MADIKETTPDSSKMDPRLTNVVENGTSTGQMKRMEHVKEYNTHDVDVAMGAMAELGGEVIDVDEQTNKRLLRTIDWHLIPLMCIIYGMNYLDKTTLSYASVMGLNEDIHLKGNNYQWLGSMFYFGYLGFEYISSRLLQRLPLAKYSAFCMVIWGGLLACFAAVSNFGGGVAIRFLLGVFESAITPGFALLTSQWYTRNEQGSRVHIWFSFNGWGQIAGGLVAYGIAIGTREHGSAMEPWKIMFLTMGLLTVLLGASFWYLIPDNQLNARWLKKEDRILAIARVRINQQGIGNKHYKAYQLREALLDPMTWAFVLVGILTDIPNGGLSNFFSQLIVGFGYTKEQSLLYGTPAGAVEVVSLLVCGYYGDKLHSRLLVGLSGLVVSILGMLLIVALPLSSNVGRLIGYYLTLASATPFVALLSLISSNVAGYTKKTTVAALYLIAYCAGNIIGPQTFSPKDAPRYVPAEVTIIICWGLAGFDVLFIWWYYRRQNRKKADARSQPGYVRIENLEWADLTDRENPEFIYTL